METTLTAATCAVEADIYMKAQTTGRKVEPWHESNAPIARLPHHGIVDSHSLYNGTIAKARLRTAKLFCFELVPAGNVQSSNSVMEGGLDRFQLSSDVPVSYDSQHRTNKNSCQVCRKV